MKRYLISLSLAVLFAVLAFTARWWLPWLLDFVGANTDLIQGMTDLIQLVLWVVAGVSLIFGFWRERNPPAAQRISTITVPGAGGAASNGGIATGAGGVAVGGNLVIANPDDLWRLIGKSRPTSDLSKLTERYLAYLVDRYQFLDFRGMGVNDRVPLQLPLIDLYVPLNARIEMPEGETWARQLRLAGRTMSEDEAEVIGQRVSEPQPVLDLLAQEHGLIILGDPGSGKTTTLKYLALYLAAGRGAEIGLDPRIPFLVPLSAYANALADQDVPLDRFINDYYAERGVDLSIGPMLHEALDKGGALLLMDGLDEIKDTTRRHLVVERVADFFTIHRTRGNKFVLSSRIVGYRDVRPTVTGLRECTLVDFDEEDIEEFVTRWTAAIESAAYGNRSVAVATAEQERVELLDATRRNPGVRTLAANPLLLTILALMKRQGVTLPERRVELYDNYVQTLLKNWNLARSLDRQMTSDMDVKETLKVLAPLAQWMHEISPGVGLVKQAAMERKLEAIYAERGSDDPVQAANAFLTDVREHAGLLLERGPREYGFIHLTFQEYLAGVAIAQQGQQRIDPIADALGDHVGDDNWHEPSLLAIGYVGLIQQREEAAAAVLQALIDRNMGEPGEAVVLAGECVLDVWPGGVTETCRNTVRSELLTTMRNEDVPAVRRAAAGRVLAKLGDPRIEVLDPLQIEWCKVPAGRFTMGGDALNTGDQQFDYVIPYAYRMARYPVTNAQFSAFVGAGGYGEERYWTEAKAANRWSVDGVRMFGDDKLRIGPRDFGEPLNLPSHPVVGVSWYEALAFARWLTEQLQGAGQLAPDWEIRLPNEPEWEKAARGTGGRLYPWKGAISTERANFDDTRIGATNAVGCFPKGISPHGCEELVGNVWEWTRSLYATYPYPHDTAALAKREDLAAGDSKRRVLRGSSFDFDEYGVRCAARYWYYPYFVGDFSGFRLVAAPILPLASEASGR